MDPNHIINLSEVLQRYILVPKLRRLADLFEVPLPEDDSDDFYLDTAKYLLPKLNSGNNARFLVQLLDLCSIRSRELIASTKWAEQDVHSAMYDKIQRLSSVMNEFDIPEEVTAPEASPFRAKSIIRDMLDEATTPVRLVDQYIGTRTLDCLRDVAAPISILTGAIRQSLEDGFLRSLSDFRSEGHEIEVRTHPKLHDRYIIFNERVWLLGGSLKDAGKKIFTAIEIVDTKQTILESVEEKWKDSGSIDENS